MPENLLKKSLFFNLLLAITIFLKERFATINNEAINFQIDMLILNHFINNRIHFPILD